MKLKYEPNAAVAEMRQFFFIELQHVLTVIYHFTAVRTIKRAHNLKKCALPGSTGTNYAHYLPVAHIQAHTLDYFECVKTFVYVFYLYHVEG